MVQGAQSIYRTVDILDVLLGSHGGMTAKEVVEVAGLPASTTHRILTVLCERGLVRQDRQTRKYFPGNVWMADCLWALPRMLHNRYYDLVPRLVEEFGYTGYLLCRMGYECLCLARTESTCSVQVFTTRPGESRLLGDGAGTFGILAFLEEEERNQILRANLPLFRQSLLRDAADIAAVLEPGERLPGGGHGLGSRPDPLRECGRGSHLADGHPRRCVENRRRAHRRTHQGVDRAARMTRPLFHDGLNRFPPFFPYHESQKPRRQHARRGFFVCI